MVRCIRKRSWPTPPTCVSLALTQAPLPVTVVMVMMSMTSEPPFTWAAPLFTWAAPLFTWPATPKYMMMASLIILMSVQSKNRKDMSTLPPKKKSVPPKKSCIKGGRYVPGTEGNTAIRNVKANKLFRAHPSVKLHIDSNSASEIWNEHRMLTYGEALTDGFTARYAKELIHIDKNTDIKLREFLAFCRGLTANVTTEYEKARLVSEAVCEALGGALTGAKGANAGQILQARMDRLVKESGKATHELMPLGETFCGGEIFGLEGDPGAGICRHRSMLFKYACDELDICDCAMIDGMMPPSFVVSKDDSAPVQAREFGNFDHMWNIVQADGNNYVVDALNWPGQLIDSKALEDLPVKFRRINGKAGLSLFAGPNAPLLEQDGQQGLIARIQRKVGWR